MKTYEFVYRAVGKGETMEEAEEDALSFVAEASAKSTLEATEWKLIDED